MILELILAVPALAGLIVAVLAVLICLLKPQTLHAQSLTRTPVVANPTGETTRHSDTDLDNLDLRRQVRDLLRENGEMKQQMESYTTAGMGALHRQEIALQAVALGIAYNNTDISEELDAINSERR